MVQLFSPTSGNQEFIAVVGSAQHKSLACCISYRQGPGLSAKTFSTHHQPLAQRSGQAKRSNQKDAAHTKLLDEKEKAGSFQALHIVKLESLNCLMTFDFVPSAILVIMSPSLSLPLAIGYSNIF